MRRRAGRGGPHPNCPAASLMGNGRLHVNAWAGPTFKPFTRSAGHAPPAQECSTAPRQGRVIDGTGRCQADVDVAATPTAWQSLICTCTRSMKALGSQPPLAVHTYRQAGSATANRSAGSAAALDRGCTPPRTTMNRSSWSVDSLLHPPRIMWQEHFEGTARSGPADWACRPRPGYRRSADAERDGFGLQLLFTPLQAGSTAADG